jgi:hypothetical protein
MRICGIDFVKRPSTRLQFCGTVFVPFKTTCYIALSVKRKLGWVRNGIVKENHVVVTASCAVSTPFRSREHDELALLVDRMDKRKCGFPFGGGDIEVVGCIAYNVEAGNLLSVGEVVF